MNTISYSFHLSRLGLIFIAGMLPISSVALHALGWVPIRWMIIPNIMMMSVCCFHLFNSAQLYKPIRNGWISGLVAVLLYDMSRIPFIYAGWEDFIPGLGGWISGTQENFTTGYMWRYFGNGAGLGLGFAILNYVFSFRKLISAGLVYGIAVFLMLDIVLLLSENAQEMMFELTPLTMAGSLVGHAMYGIVLGTMMKKLQK